ncbi:MAG TPA: hypothetical protein VFZ59_21880 [Verrucomicrobiae bacterium]|nr:hypothetical protein [Verrucomicrobiae bacterium]
MQSSILGEVASGFQVVSWFAPRSLRMGLSVLPAREWFVGPGHLLEMLGSFWKPRGGMRPPDRRCFDGWDEMERLKEVLR